MRGSGKSMPGRVFWSRMIDEFRFDEFRFDEFRLRVNAR
jgi:hypothetical protein